MNDDPQSMLDLSDFLDGIEKDDASAEDIEELLHPFNSLMKIQKEIQNAIGRIEDLQGELDAERTLEQVINEIKKEINK